ncbi:hypothetical protein KKC36_00895, partial [Patescibacteria group bacterium]|nr:hypothetical protein [Patescibacteria group bacterium]
MPAQTIILDLNTIFAFLILVPLVGLILFFLGYLVFTLFKFRGREEKSLDSVLLQVAVTRNNEIKIDAMEQLFASLYSIKKGGWKQKFSVQPAISFEIVARQEDIKFYVWTPKEFKDLIEKQINGAYPDAEILEVEEFNIFKEKGKVAYKSFQLSRNIFYPVKTYKDLPTDPMASITSALAKMGSNEGASVQILISPANSKWQKEGRKFISGTKKDESDPEKAKFATSAKSLEAVEGKIGKPGFETSIRIVVSAANKDAAKRHLNNISSSIEQFSGENNGFKKRKIRIKGTFVDDFLYRYQPMFNLFGNHVSILNSEELATIFHFPNKQVTTPHIYWLNAKTAPAPSEIPTEGIFLGNSNYRGLKRKVFISEDDRRRHLYIIGKTGVGKSELLKQMIMQ